MTLPEKKNLLFNNIVNDIGEGRYRSAVPSISTMAWNLRHAPLPLIRPGSVVMDALEMFAPAIAVFTECPRHAFSRTALEMQTDSAYRFLMGSGNGDQRIVIAYDTTRVRLKDRPAPLSGPFVRAPLWAYFAVLFDDQPEPVDIQVVGAHFKSQGGGHTKQRVAEAEALAGWIMSEASRHDADLLVLGDFNSTPHQDDLSALSQLERKGEVSFHSITASNEVGMLLRKVRVWPESQFSSGEHFLDAKFSARGVYNHQRKTTGSPVIDLETLLAETGDRPFTQWMRSLTVPAPQLFLPQVFGVYFLEFEPLAQGDL